MAKRLTDTTKWTNKSFRALPDKFKLLYLYILDNCDAAGVIRFDLDLVGYTLGHSFSLAEIKSALDGKVVFLSEDKLIVRNYIAFQNGDVTKSDSKIAGSIRSTLNSHGLLKRYIDGEFGVTNSAVGDL
jgi:hypothetical protein